MNKPATKSSNYLQFEVNGKDYSLEQMNTLPFPPDVIVKVYYIGVKKTLTAEFEYQKMFN